MFNPTRIDEVSIQAIHLEARSKNVNPEIVGSSKPTVRKNKEKKKHKWKERKVNDVQKTSLHALTTRRMGMMMNIVGFFIRI